MYIRGLIPRNFAEFAKALPIEVSSPYPFMPNFGMILTCFLQSLVPGGEDNQGGARLIGTVCPPEGKLSVGKINWDIGCCGSNTFYL